MKNLLAALIWVFLVHVPAYAQTPFYQGKTIRIVTGYPAGDVNDLWPRLIARYMTKYIPGGPTFVIQNMPGASSMIAANYVFTVAKPDGLTLGWIAPTLYFDQLVGRQEAKFDWARYSFVGSPAQSEHQLYMRSDSPYKTIEACARPTSRPSAVRAGPPVPVFTSPGCWRKPSAPSSTLYSAIRAEDRSISRWRRARSIAAP